MSKFIFEGDTRYYVLEGIDLDRQLSLVGGGLVLTEILNMKI